MHHFFNHHHPHPHLPLGECNLQREAHLEVLEMLLSFKRKVPLEASASLDTVRSLALTLEGKLTSGPQTAGQIHFYLNNF